MGINTEEAGKGSVPVGTVAYFAMATPPAGYLKADGSAIGRETYPELFAAIGTTFGKGDGSTTFKLPNLMGRFAEGSVTPGTMKEAGLPNITGSIPKQFLANNINACTGAFTHSWSGKSLGGFPDNPNWNITTNGGESYFQPDFKASAANPIYGNSDTVQPPALTLLPCIKAFHA